jgi:hypothetical protein
LDSKTLTTGSLYCVLLAQDLRLRFLLDQTPAVAALAPKVGGSPRERRNGTLIVDALSSAWRLLSPTPKHLGLDATEQKKLSF